MQYATLYVLILIVFIGMLETLQYIIMIILQLLIVMYVFIHLNSAHHTL